MVRTRHKFFFDLFFFERNDKKKRAKMGRETSLCFCFDKIARCLRNRFNDGARSTLI